METPILFIIFNRPKFTRESFQAIAKAKPKRLYVSADGPRAERPNESALCEEARAVIELVDWPCEVATQFSDHNLGCKRGVVKAIDWFFSEEEDGIIIEDDCVPSQSFFSYCQELLEKYRQDDRIFMITGSNRFGEYTRFPEFSYFFSNLGEIWGWATWKRAWNKYDPEMECWPDAKRKELLYNYYDSIAWALRLEERFDKVFQGLNDTWDYQWLLTLVLNNGISVIPSKNLISNIGFGQDATHTFNVKHKTAGLPNYELVFPLIHPYFTTRDARTDLLQFRKYLRPGITWYLRNISKLVKMWRKYKLT